MPVSYRAIGLMALLATSALAEAREAPAPAEPGPVLWGALTAGMPQREADKAVSGHAIGLTDQCGAKPTLAFSRGRLASVTLTGRQADHSAALCAERVRATLVAQYGASDGALERSLENRSWIYRGPSPLPRMVRSIDPTRVAFEAWSTKDKSLLFTSSRRGGRWSILFVPNATPVANPTQL